MTKLNDMSFFEKEEKDMLETVSTIHERDLDVLLNKFGIKAVFYDGKLKCKFCGGIVNKENIYSFLPESGMVNVICSSPTCITAFFSYLDEKRINKKI